MHLSHLHHVGGAPLRQVIPRTDGTLIGNMTDYGGLAGGFDGVWCAPHYPNQSAVLMGNPAYGALGKAWATPRIVYGFKAGSTSDRGWCVSGSGTVVLTLLGSNTNNPATATSLGSTPPSTGLNDLCAVIEKYDCNPAGIPYLYHWVKIVISGGSSHVYICELDFYELRWI